MIFIRRSRAASASFRFLSAVLLFVATASFASVLPMLTTRKEAPASNPNFHPSLGSQSPSAATNERGLTLVAWVRVGKEIVAARLDASGTLLDPIPLRLGFTIDEWHVPTVVSTGSEFLVVWRAETFVMVRVSEDGEILDTRQVRLGGPSSLAAPAIAWNGTNSLLVYEVDHRLLGALLDREANVLAQAIPVPGGRGQGNPFVATNASEFLVIWDDFTAEGFEIGASRISASGQPLDPTGIPIGRTRPTQVPPKPRAAWNGSRFVVVWRDEGIHRSLLDRGMLTPALRLGGSVYPWTEASVECQANGCLVAWYDSRQVEAVRLDAAGSIADSAALETVSSFTARTPPAITLRNASYLVVWEDGSIKGRLVPADGEIPRDGANDIMVALTPATHRLSALATDGTDYLVVWVEVPPFVYATRRPPPTGRVLAARFRSSGERIDDVAIAISQDGAEIQTPAIAFDGANYLIAWSQRGGGIHLRRLSPGGNVLDAADSIVGPSNAGSPRLAWNGSNYLLVYTSAATIYGARVRPTGIVDDPRGFFLAADGGSPDIAWDGANYLVVWSSGEDILGSRVSPFGFRVDSTPIPVARSLYREFSPSISWNGAHYLVVWESRNEGSDIYATRVTPEGTILDPGFDGEGFPIATAKLHDAAPVVTWTGRDFLVVWMSGIPSDLFGARVTPEMRLADGPPERGGVLLARSADGPPGLAAISPRSVAVSYTRFIPEMTTNRTFVRVFDLERRRGASRSR